MVTANLPSSVLLSSFQMAGATPLPVKGQQFTVAL